jgi:hypothetical protein
MGTVPKASPETNEGAEGQRQRAASAGGELAIEAQQERTVQARAHVHLARGAAGVAGQHRGRQSGTNHGFHGHVPAQAPAQRNGQDGVAGERIRSRVDSEIAAQRPGMLGDRARAGGQRRRRDQQRRHRSNQSHGANDTPGTARRLNGTPRTGQAIYKRRNVAIVAFGKC